jgi:methylated-DNA-[protein]-cysteine S-methyltransferase
MTKEVQKKYFFKIMKSPVGELKIIASATGLAAILWNPSSHKATNEQGKKYGNAQENKNLPMLLKTEKELKEYFAKKRKKFTIKLDFIGTEFQKSVWTALLIIPFGETRSYGDIAKQIGNPKAVRAVGGASGKNPISIIVPCHRVIGTSGKLTGFASGLDNKKYLLGLESKK